MRKVYTSTNWCGNPVTPEARTGTPITGLPDANKSILSEKNIRNQLREYNNEQ